MDVLQILGITSTAAVIVGGCVLFGLRHYFGGYLDKKAENLATKEDIGDITKIVESIKHENDKVLSHWQEQLKSATTLRFLAAERRFQAHQDAYRYAIQMKQMAFTEDYEERQKASADWGDFWQRNCLYLDENVRSAFSEAAMASAEHTVWLRMGREIPEGRKYVSTNMQKMDHLLEVIPKAVSLPAIVNEYQVATAKSADEG